MYHEHHIVRDAEMFVQGIEVLAMLDKSIRAGSTIVQLVRIPHADQVRRNAPSQLGEVGHDVTPQIGRGGIAV